MRRWLALALAGLLLRPVAAEPWLRPADLPWAPPALAAEARAVLLAQADVALQLVPPTVLDKTLLPASGDRRDYLSFGPYWWPDPTKPDGLPYVRRDGQRNPASANGSDAAALARIGRAVEVLGLAYEATGDERYASKAAQLARVWFLDDQRGMRPNFLHAQAIPGVTSGRGIGIIEARWLIAINEGLARLAGSIAWGEAEQAALREWMAVFYGWLRSHPNGLDEEAEHNNHGSWYDALVVHLALVLGEQGQARERLRVGLQRRLEAHVDPDGSQPHELARTLSLDYSLFNLEALAICAELGERVGVDWWGHVSSDGRSLAKALRYLLPYLLDPNKPWPHAQLKPADRRRLIPMIAVAARGRADAELTAALRAALPTAEAGKLGRILSGW
ncbi:MAG: alginate lyase family protein [Burkholderiales bacterium]|nr:alginate lyase family protein [Burkholderiales bacterium]